MKTTNERVQQIILSGQVRVQIVRVSKSGMTRFMKFYGPDFENITSYISEMTGRIMKDGCLKVGGCGMDMCFHALYCALGYELAKDWDQRYYTL